MALNLPRLIRVGSVEWDEYQQYQQQRECERQRKSTNSISYAITVHNEGNALGRLASVILDVASNNNQDYEVVIVDDYSDDPLTLHILECLKDHLKVSIYQHGLNNDFAAQKNYLNSKCSKTWIMNIDCDEELPIPLIEALPGMIADNTAEAFWFPRLNTVDGLTAEHINRWGWRVETVGYEQAVQWPDNQLRLYRNTPSIYWVGNVHERLTGFTEYSTLPPDIQYAIRHRKSINKQEKQNAFYQELVNGTP